MFGSFSEYLIILGVALLVLGPEQLLPLVQRAGRYVGMAQAYLAQLQAPISTDNSRSLHEQLQQNEAKAALADAKYSPTAANDHEESIHGTHRHS